MYIHTIKFTHVSVSSTWKTQVIFQRLIQHMLTCRRCCCCIQLSVTTRWWWWNKMSVSKCNIPKKLYSSIYEYCIYEYCGVCWCCIVTVSKQVLVKCFYFFFFLLHFLYTCVYVHRYDIAANINKDVCLHVCEFIFCLKHISFEFWYMNYLMENIYTEYVHFLLVLVQFIFWVWFKINILKAVLLFFWKK